MLVLGGVSVVGAAEVLCRCPDDDADAADAITTAKGEMVLCSWGINAAAAALDGGAVHSGLLAAMLMLAADDDDDDDPELPSSAAA